MICDLHTHTTYCDGANTPKEMLLSAIEKGLKTYGFSSHSYLSFDSSWNMNENEQKKYIAEILSLRDKYKDQIDVLLGTEYDLLSEIDLTPFDYVIGSCHGFFKDGNYISVDHSQKVFEEVLERFYGGDAYAFASDYFEKMTTASDKKEITFFGYFDLINKFNRDFRFFDENNIRYKNPMLCALEKLAKTEKPFELNTSHTFRQNEKEASVSARCWLSALCEMGGKIIINSDAHSTDRIGYNFENAKAFAKDCGFKTVLALTGNGFCEIKL